MPFLKNGSILNKQHIDVISQNHKIVLGIEGTQPAVVFAQH